MTTTAAVHAGGRRVDLRRRDHRLAVVDRLRLPGAKRPSSLSHDETAAQRLTVAAKGQRELDGSEKR